jgi:hypothetical protein
VTLLSTPAEWHAFGLGVGYAYVGERYGDRRPLARCTTYASGLRSPPAGHLSDLPGEAAYFAGGVLLGSAIGRL